MSLRVYVLRGGMFGWDGPVTSAGMDSLAKQIAAIPDTTVSVHNWSDYYAVAAAIYTSLPPSDRLAIVGYSGGGLYAAVISRMIKGRIVDLIVALDPSPAMPVTQNPLGGNVLKAICYHNQAPYLFGYYGGGLLRGPHVEVRTVSENHLAVQFDTAVRAGTIAAVRGVA